MEEVLFTSGRNLPNIDPSLHIWHWPISLYLFLGGLAAGILFFAALFFILGKEDEYPGGSQSCLSYSSNSIGIGIGSIGCRLNASIVFLAIVHHFQDRISDVLGRLGLINYYAAGYVMDL